MHADVLVDSLHIDLRANQLSVANPVIVELRQRAPAAILDSLS
jgi:hypothetical protein